MTPKAITKLPALGQAWHGDWVARVHDRLRARGFETVTAFAEAHPTASLLALAEDLSTDRDVGIDRADVASDQLARVWREEAKRQGRNGIERMARRVLVGELHRGIPDGWVTNWNEPDAKANASRLTLAASTWIGNLDEDRGDAAHRVYTAMIEQGRDGRIPPGWLPASADDPILASIFERCWWEPA